MIAPVDSPPAATLDHWIVRHGPLGVPEALHLALSISARASQLDAARLAETLGSLNSSGVARGATAGWSWEPRPSGTPRPVVTDADVLERIGGVLFHCLTGRPHDNPHAEAAAVARRLKQLCPVLSPAVASLTVGAMTARTGSGVTVGAFAGEIRGALGIPASPTGRRTRWLNRRPAALIAAVTAVVTALVFATAREPVGRGGEGGGLTDAELDAGDVLMESVQVFALMDEHSAASRLLQALDSRWRARLPLDDPRLGWAEAHNAWVRTLAGDHLTTEQVLEQKPSWLAAQLGDSHPYTRAVRLGLATVLEARGAVVDAGRHRAAAARSERELFHGVPATFELLPGWTAPPGVVAHVAPNRPEREGFRRTGDGRFSRPLTSVQRMLAGHEGWRLHLVARDHCRVSLVTGNAPHGFAVQMVPAASSGWQVRIQGTRPAPTITVASAEALGVSVFADATGAIRLRVGNAAPLSLRADAAAAAPDPPYSFTFEHDRTGSGCMVAWLEIPFPLKAAFGTTPAFSPTP